MKVHVEGTGVALRQTHALLAGFLEVVLESSTEEGRSIDNRDFVDGEFGLLWADEHLDGFGELEPAIECQLWN